VHACSQAHSATGQTTKCVPRPRGRRAEDGEECPEDVKKRGANRAEGELSAARGWRRTDVVARAGLSSRARNRTALATYRWRLAAGHPRLGPWAPFPNHPRPPKQNTPGPGGRLTMHIAASVCICRAFNFPGVARNTHQPQNR
jgi:hypothetical protein